MKYLKELLEEGLIDESYQLECECEFPLWTNENMTVVDCSNEVCVHKGAEKLAYANKLLEIKNVGSARSLQLIDFPGIRTHMDIYRLTTHKLMDLNGNMLKLPIVPIVYEDEIVLYVKSPLGIYKIILQNQEIPANLDVKELVEILYREILPNTDLILPNPVDILDINEELKPMADYISQWNDSERGYISAFFHYCPNSIAVILDNSEVSVGTNSYKATNEDKYKVLRYEKLQEDELSYFEDLVYYNPQQIMKHLKNAFGMYLKVRENGFRDELHFRTICNGTLYALSLGIMDDGIIDTNLLPIIEKMEEVRRDGIYLSKYIEMWNFSAIGTIYSQKIFLKYDNIEQFYNDLDDTDKMSTYIAEALGIARYTDTVYNICETLNVYKEMILEVSRSFKFKPVGVGKKPIVISITGEVAPVNGVKFKPRDKFSPLAPSYSSGLEAATCDI